MMEAHKKTHSYVDVHITLLTEHYDFIRERYGCRGFSSAVRALIKDYIAENGFENGKEYNCVSSEV